MFVKRKITNLGKNTKSPAAVRFENIVPVRLIAMVKQEIRNMEAEIYFKSMGMKPT